MCILTYLAIGLAAVCAQSGKGLSDRNACNDYISITDTLRQLDGSLHKVCALNDWKCSRGLRNPGITDGAKWYRFEGAKNDMIPEREEWYKGAQDYSRRWRRCGTYSPGWIRYSSAPPNVGQTVGASICYPNPYCINDHCGKQTTGVKVKLCKGEGPGPRVNYYVYKLRPADPDWGNGPFSICTTDSKLRANTYCGDICDTRTYFTLPLPQQQPTLCTGQDKKFWNDGDRGCRANDPYCCARKECPSSCAAEWVLKPEIDQNSDLCERKLLNETTLKCGGQDEACCERKVCLSRCSSGWAKTSVQSPANCSGQCGDTDPACCERKSCPACPATHYTVGGSAALCNNGNDEQCTIDDPVCCAPKICEVESCGPTMALKTEPTPSHCEGDRQCALNDPACCEAKTCEGKCLSIYYPRPDANATNCEGQCDNGDDVNCCDVKECASSLCIGAWTLRENPNPELCQGRCGNNTPACCVEKACPTLETGKPDCGEDATPVETQTPIACQGQCTTDNINCCELKVCPECDPAYVALEETDASKCIGQCTGTSPSCCTPKTCEGKCTDSRYFPLPDVTSGCPSGERCQSPAECLGQCVDNDANCCEEKTCDDKCDETTHDYLTLMDDESGCPAGEECQNPGACEEQCEQNTAVCCHEKSCDGMCEVSEKYYLRQGVLCYPWYEELKEEEARWERLYGVSYCTDVLGPGSRAPDEMRMNATECTGRRCTPGDSACCGDKTCEGKCEDARWFYLTDPTPENCQLRDGTPWKCKNGDSNCCGVKQCPPSCAEGFMPKPPNNETMSWSEQQPQMCETCDESDTTCQNYGCSDSDLACCQQKICNSCWPGFIPVPEESENWPVCGCPVDNREICCVPAPPPAPPTSDPVDPCTPSWCPFDQCPLGVRVNSGNSDTDGVYVPDLSRLPLPPRFSSALWSGLSPEDKTSTCDQIRALYMNQLRNDTLLPTAFFTKPDPINVNVSWELSFRPMNWTGDGIGWGLYRVDQGAAGASRQLVYNGNGIVSKLVSFKADGWRRMDGVGGAVLVTCLSSICEMLTSENHCQREGECVWNLSRQECQPKDDDEDDNGTGDFRPTTFFSLGDSRPPTFPPISTSDNTANGLPSFETTATTSTRSSQLSAFDITANGGGDTDFEGPGRRRQESAPIWSSYPGRFAVIGPSYDFDSRDNINNYTNSQNDFALYFANQPAIKLQMATNQAALLEKRVPEFSGKFSYPPNPAYKKWLIEHKRGVSVHAEEDCTSCPADLDALVEELGGVLRPERKFDSKFWREFREVTKMQDARRRGAPPRLLVPVPRLWMDKSLNQIAFDVYEDSPGIYALETIDKFLDVVGRSRLALDRTLFDREVIPSDSLLDFVRGGLVLTELAGFASHNVSEVLYTLKWREGKARPQEIAWKIAKGELTTERHAVPRQVVRDIERMKLRRPEEFTAYWPVGAPLAPSWPSLHGAASLGSMWAPLVLNLGREAICELRKTDWIVAYGRVIAGVAYKEDVIAGLNLAQKVLLKELPSKLQSMFPGVEINMTRVEIKQKELIVDWDNFRRSECITGHVAVASSCADAGYRIVSRSAAECLAAAEAAGYDFTQTRNGGHDVPVVPNPEEDYARDCVACVSNTGRPTLFFNRTGQTNCNQDGTQRKFNICEADVAGLHTVPPANPPTERRRTHEQNFVLKELTEINKRRRAAVAAELKQLQKDLQLNEAGRRKVCGELGSLKEAMGFERIAIKSCA